jgi:hypothetical protein
MELVARRLLSAPVVLAIFFVAIPPALFYWHPHSFWASTDYQPHSLADGLNMAYRLADFKLYPARGLMDHPGVPFYFMSWLALALTGYPVASAGPDFLASVMPHVEKFHQVTIWLGALVGGCGVYIFAHAARKLVPIGVVLISLVIWLVSTPATLLMFMSPSIDSFALLINGLFFLTLVRLAYDSEITPRLVIIAACVGAFAYLNKLSYVYVPLALLAVIVVSLVLRGSGWLRSGRLLALYVAALISTVAAVGFIIIGRYGFRVLRDFHKSVILGSGMYGTGARDVVSGDEVWHAIMKIPDDGAYAMFIALAAGIFLIVGGFVAGLRSERHAPVAIMSIGAGIASVLSVLIVLKHYDRHYTAGVSATLPCCVVAGYLLMRPWADRLRQVWIPLATVAMLSMAWLILPKVIALQVSNAAESERAKADSEDLHAFIAQAKGLVEFAYRTDFPEYGEGFLIAFASVPRLTDAYVQTRTKVSSSMADALIDREVSAYVIDKNYFPTVESLKAAPNVALLGSKPVKFKEGDKLIELRTAYILIPG